MEIIKIKKTLDPIFKKYKDKIIFAYLFGSVALDYENINPEIICSGIIPGFKDVESFVDQIRKSLSLK